MISKKYIGGRKYSNWFIIFFRLHNFYLITFTYVIIYTGLYTDNAPKTHQLLKCVFIVFYDKVRYKQLLVPYKATKTIKSLNLNRKFVLYIAILLVLL